MTRAKKTKRENNLKVVGKKGGLLDQRDPVNNP